MTFNRGDVVVATDPFHDEESGRPFVIISHPATPFHGEQYIVLALTTRTWHDERVPIADDEWVDGGAPESSSIMPWSANTLKSDWVAFHQGTIAKGLVDRAVAELVDYVS